MSESEQSFGSAAAEPQPGAGAAFWAARGVRIEPEPDDDGPDRAPDHGPDHEPAAVAGRHQRTDQSPRVPESRSEADPPSDAGAELPVTAPMPAQVPAPRAAQTRLDEVEPQAGEVVDGLAALDSALADSRRAKARARAEATEPAWQLTENGLSAPLPPLRTCLEAILMVVDEPVTDVVLAQVVERPKAEVTQTLRELAAQYTDTGRGFELREVGVGESGHTGWRIYSRAECAPVVERFIRDGQQARLTQAALETLAVVAYRQPVSRSKVSGIRGVNCDGVMRTLVARGLVEECGTEHETGALLYRTTGYFLERMGLKSLLELPDLAPLLPSAADLEDEQY